MDADQLHIFRISIDVRKFWALRRLPTPVASIYVKVTFPSELVQLAAESIAKQPGANVAALTAPLRTHPLVEVARQSEVALSNGFVALEFPATIMAMATALARGANLVTQVYHRDRYAADRLLAVGSVPMAALLEEPWLDGYVPMLALKTLPAKPGKGPVEERVAVGRLRLVLVIEELGLVAGPCGLKRRSEAAIRPEVPPAVAEDLPWPEPDSGVALPEYAGSVVGGDLGEEAVDGKGIAGGQRGKEYDGRKEGLVTSGGQRGKGDDDRNDRSVMPSNQRGEGSDERDEALVTPGGQEQTGQRGRESFERTEELSEEQRPRVDEDDGNWEAKEAIEAVAANASEGASPKPEGERLVSETFFEPAISTEEAATPGETAILRETATRREAAAFREAAHFTEAATVSEAAISRGNERGALGKGGSKQGQEGVNGRGRGEEEPGGSDRTSVGMRTPASIRAGPEYEAAWELEVWKQKEESKFKAELEERAAARMEALEEEWKRREKTRVAETEATRAEQAALSSKLSAQLSSLAEREKKLMEAETAASAKREALEREAAQRTADVKAAIKRLKEECEHQLKLERSRYEELARQKKGLEERLSLAEASRGRLERDFSEFRAAQRSTPEAELAAQVVTLQQRNADLQRQADRAAAAKKQYKAQVLRMARKLAAMQRQQIEEEAERLAKERKLLEARALASSAKEEADRARDERSEMAAVKEQLARLREREHAAEEHVAAAAAFRALSLQQEATHHRKGRRNGRRPKEPTSALEEDVAQRKRVHRKEEKDHVGDLTYVGTLGHVDALEAAEAELRRGAVRSGGHLQGSSCSGTDAELEALEATNLVEPASRQEVGSENLHTEAVTVPKQAVSPPNKEVVRLLRERAALLRTGVYRREDKVIVALEKEIERRSAGK